MGKIIAIANQKGGVGKTTTSMNLAAGLAYVGKRVMLVDFDPQGNATHGIGANRAGFTKSVYDVLMSDTTADEAKVTLQMPPLDVLPSTIDLSGADVDMASYEIGREQLLKKKLDAVRDNYDYIIIDCPPALGLLNTNALTAADTVMIPVQCEYFALEGLTQLLSTIRLVQKLWNPRLSIEGVLLTMFDVRTKLSVEVQQEVRKYADRVRGIAGDDFVVEHRSYLHWDGYVVKPKDDEAYRKNLRENILEKAWRAARG